MNKIEMYSRMMDMANQCGDYELFQEMENRLQRAKDEQNARAELSARRNAPKLSAIRNILKQSPHGATAVEILWADSSFFEGTSTHTIVNLLRGMVRNGEVEARKIPQCCGSRSNTYVLVEVR